MSSHAPDSTHAPAPDAPRGKTVARPAHPLILAARREGRRRAAYIFDRVLADRLARGDRNASNAVLGEHIGGEKVIRQMREGLTAIGCGDVLALGNRGVARDYLLALLRECNSGSATIPIVDAVLGIVDVVGEVARTYREVAPGGIDANEKARLRGVLLKAAAEVAALLQRLDEE